jgi:hypothetical protein
VSVIVTLRVSGDPAKFEEQVESQRDAIDRIMAVAKSHGLIAHRWYGGEGEFMAVDEWPDAASFQSFFDEAQGDIAPVMQGTGVTAEPSVSVWRKLDTNDEVGWGA